MEFSEKPQIYNEFLEIMKSFKAQKISTPGVIERVKNLFKGYNRLILGFNTFLPEGEGHKIELTPEEEAGGFANESKIGGQDTSAAHGSSSSGNPPAPATGPEGGAAPAAGQQLQQRHAISYVTTIRNRFANEPDTYRAFLKILHTYQKEQKGIKDVLEQVSLLFADHPDLLMEFTYFLPDAVQDQAKERLNRAARESEMRRRLLQAQQQTQAQAMLGKRAAGGGRKSASYQHQQMMQQQHAQQQALLAQQRRQQKGFQHQQMRGHYGGDQRGRESSHVSSTTERRFFDSVKDLLTSTTRDGWNEFVKHLDLFATDAITKRDLLNFSSDIFGPAGQDLFVELKRIMAAKADYDGHGADMYYAIPTSEIDFNQCKRCSPSYRALPKDYPKPICSERSKMEESVLNDEWITFPFGHEDNYTFRHMIKNSAEEELFKCEEDRFEIDMIIDGNYCTIRILEPIAEEISNMRSLEDNDNGNGSSAPRFQLQLEKRNLTCIHLNAISRLYGEHGAEILELLHKNPVGTIPIVLKRLKQKDTEWRKARQDLNAKWKEVVERNYEKSFDHRSFYFKKQDKRFCDVKQLVNDIRDFIPSGQPGSLLIEGESIPAPVSDMTSTGGAQTHASSLTVDVAEVELSQLTRDMFTPGRGFINIMGKYESPLTNHVPLLYGAKPQLALRFNNKHHSVHKDIYSMFCHVAETAMLPASDKERVSFLWRDLLRVFFNLPVHYLYSDLAATAATVLADTSSKARADKAQENKTVNNAAMDVEGGGSEGPTPVPQGTTSATAVAAGLTAATLDAVPVDPSEAWQNGVRVLTAYGSGVIIAYRPKDSMYIVGLCFGTAYVKPSCIVGAEELNPAALTALGINKVGVDATADDVVFGQQLPTVETFVGDPLAVPAAAAVAAAAATSRRSKSDKAAPAKVSQTYNDTLPEPARLLLSTPVGYAFMRMYHAIYTRLSYARDLADGLSSKRIGVVTSGIGSGTGVLNEGKLHPLAYMDASDEEAKLVAASQEAKPLYALWMGQLLGLLDTSLDSNRYEDSCRQILGNRSYALFTLDKLVQQCFKCLQSMANEEAFNKLVGLFVYHRSRSSAFHVVSKLAGSGANYGVAAASCGGGAVVAPAPDAASAGRKRGNAASSTSSSSGGSLAIKNIETIQNAINRGGIDPVAYTVHVAKMFEQSQMSEDIYRIQNIPTPGVSFSEGESIVTCQLLGSLGGGDNLSKNNLKQACLGSPMPMPTMAANIKTDDNAMDMSV